MKSLVCLCSLIALTVLFVGAGWADPAGFIFERSIPTFAGTYPLAVDSNGGLFFGTIAGASTALYYIADPVNDGTNIQTVAAVTMTDGRGITGIDVDSSDNVYFTADDGPDFPVVFKKYGPAPTFVPSAAFVPDATRQQGLALVGDGVIVATKFPEAVFFDTTTGATLGSLVTNASYQRDAAYNPHTEDIYIHRSGMNYPSSVILLSGGSATNVAGYVLSVSPFIDNTRPSHSTGAYTNGLFFYPKYDWLLVNNNVGSPNRAIQVYRVTGKGASAQAALVYEFDGLASGTAIGSTTGFGADAAVHEYPDAERIFISDNYRNRILVYRLPEIPPTATPSTGIQNSLQDYR